VIAAWMLYTVGVTLLLLAGASAAEYVARALRVPTRLVWVAATIAAVGLSARAFIAGSHARPGMPVPASNRTISVGAATLNGGDALANPLERRSADAGLIVRIKGIVRDAVAALRHLGLSAARVDARSLDRWNGLLVGLWVSASAVALSLLMGSLLKLRRIERNLATTMVRDDPVLVSRHLGPAVIGILRSRIVLPEWVLALPVQERDTVLAHERQHAAAFDPALLVAAVFVAALQPWNVGLWALLARLRTAIEGDCDRRVLARMTDPDWRWYGHLLVSVYERATPGLSLTVGFVARPSNLERRIRRIARRPRVISMAGLASSLASVLLVLAACRAAAPMRYQSPLPVAQAAPSTARPAESRCSLSARRAERQHTVLWPRQWPVNAGCSLYGDIVVVTIDSTRLLVAARDTADVGITAFFVFQTRPGTTTPDLVWSTTRGRAELSDTAMSFAGTDGGTRGLVLRTRPVRTNDRLDVLELHFAQMMMAEMSGTPWESIAALPTSPRCTPGQREVQRACFVVRGQRFEFPLPNWTE
jgi:hypothetical protein